MMPFVAFVDNPEHTPPTKRPLARAKLEQPSPDPWVTLLRPRIVASHHATTAVAEGDHAVRVLGDQWALVTRTAFGVSGEWGCRPDRAYQIKTL